ncbi:hypothetical protein ECC16_03895 [Helicobacter pylori]|uniref:nucleoside-diphosphate kinase n=1 Tax=Helicobacter pylori TaxID=210 RepID=UPI000FDEE9A2|nr:nucleoside-diphosphate kinase [Helicobacter pylori]RVY30595.1 hypothetical protein ECC16_03895 [Helicobacter pylori]RVZ17740.1 hypothetical protein EC534_03895 [Helicobacter pylori]
MQFEMRKIAFNAPKAFSLEHEGVVLEGEDAVAKNRDLMGATDPKLAQKGTIRADFAESIDANAVHGSDSLENAHNEIAFFFAARDL